MSVTYGKASNSKGSVDHITTERPDGSVMGLCGSPIISEVAVPGTVCKKCLAAQAKAAGGGGVVSKRGTAPSAPGDVDGGVRRGAAAAGAVAGGVGRAVQAATVVAPEVRVVGPGYKSRDPVKVEWVGLMIGLVDAVEGMMRTREVDRAIGMRFFPGWRVSKDGGAVFVCTSKEEERAWDDGFQFTQEFYAPLGGSRDPYPMPDDCIIWSWMFEKCMLPDVWATVMYL